MAEIQSKSDEKDDDAPFETGNELVRKKTGPAQQAGKIIQIAPNINIDLFDSSDEGLPQHLRDETLIERMEE